MRILIYPYHSQQSYQSKSTLKIYIYNRINLQYLHGEVNISSSLTHSFVFLFCDLPTHLPCSFFQLTCLCLILIDKIYLLINITNLSYTLQIFQIFLSFKIFYAFFVIKSIRLSLLVSPFGAMFMKFSPPQDYKIIHLSFFSTSLILILKLTI